MQKLYSSRPCDIAIITAKHDKEFEELDKIFDGKLKDEDILDYTATYYKTTLRDKNGKKLKIVISTINSMGMTSTASLVMKLIFHYKPKYICMVGICASSKKDVHNIGDIIIPAITWDYGVGKQVEEEINGKPVLKFEPQLDQKQLNKDIQKIVLELKESEKYLEDIKNTWVKEYNHVYSPKNDIKMYYGHFASGSAVIQSQNFVDKIIEQHSKLIGFDMEAHAVFDTVNNSPIEGCKAFVIKSVSDFGDSDKQNPQKEKHQQYAAFTSSQYLKHLIVNELEF